MSALTTDPIVSEQTVLEMLKGMGGAAARMYINSVSEQFLRFTGRTRINKGTITERHVAPPPHLPVLWLRAFPIDAVTTINLYERGELVRAMTNEDYSLNTHTGRFVLMVPINGYPGPEQVIEATYTGGWETVPGDVVLSALEMVKLQHLRLGGRAGVLSESREGYSASYDASGVPQAVADVWQRYRVYG